MPPIRTVSTSLPSISAPLLVTLVKEAAFRRASLLQGDFCLALCRASMACGHPAAPEGKRNGDGADRSVGQQLRTVSLLELPDCESLRCSQSPETLHDRHERLTTTMASITDGDPKSQTGRRLSQSLGFTPLASPRHPQYPANYPPRRVREVLHLVQLSKRRPRTLFSR